MSETKAKIDIKTGIIELEGSEKFVTKYLDEFKRLIPVTKLGKTMPEAQPPSEKQPEKKKGKSKPKTRSTAPKVTQEKYDIHGNETVPSLKSFFEEKKPGRANGDIVAVLGYYITEILGMDFFTDGQIEYSYKMLKLKRPAHLHQIMINNKNEKDYYEGAEGEVTNQWVMTRNGDIFVSEELPGTAK